MSHKVRYMIFTGTSVYAVSAINELERKVQDALASGWRPVGGVSVGGGSQNWTAAQAMMKEEIDLAWLEKNLDGVEKRSSH